MQDYKKLKVWVKSHLLAVSLYKITSDFPNSEMFGLTSQIRRAGTSIPANIAEGCGRDGNAELNRFLHISLGSANELEYYLVLSNELAFLNIEDYKKLDAQVNEIKSMLITLINKLKT